MKYEKSSVSFPALAFALGIFLYSEDMLQAFTAGILLILTASIALCAKNMMQKLLPSWSLHACLWIFSGAVSVAVFHLAFYTQGIEYNSFVTATHALIGILAAEDILKNIREPWDEGFLYECCMIWFLWICTGILREVSIAGTISGIRITNIPLQSGSFQKPMFSFLAAGITISAACLFLNKNCSKTKTLYMTIPAILCTRPFQIHNGGKAAEFFIPTAIAFLFYFSVRKKQQSTTRREVLEGLPSELISVGIIYMILSVY